MKTDQQRRESFLAATAELGKLGITLKNSHNGTKAEMLAERADLRRGINTLRDEARKVTAAPGTPGSERFGELVDAIEACSDMIDKVSNQLDLDEAATAAFSGRASATGGDSILRDQEGKRIGVLLSNADLRDPVRIASQLGTDRRTVGHDSEEDSGLAAFFRGIAGGRTTEAIRNSLSEGTDSAGGHAVPTWLLPGILSALTPASSMLSAGANIGVLQQPGDSFKIAAVDTVPTAAWRAENGNLSESDPTFRAVTVVPRSLAFIFKVSRELLMDAPGMEQALRIAIAQAFAKEIDRAGLIGTGTAPEIRGILNTTGVNTYSMGTNGDQLENYAPIIRASRLIADDNAPAPNAIITSTREDETIALFADTTGQPLRRPPSLESMQFLATSQIPVNEDQGTAENVASTMFLGKYSLATFYMREQMSVQKLNELYAAAGQVGFACHARVDLALAYPAAFCTIRGVIPA